LKISQPQQVDFLKQKDGLMKTILMTLVSLALAGSTGFAEETIGEKASSTGKSVKRSANKAWNRTKEAVCMEGDLKCAGKKVKNRAGEGVDYVQDKTGDAKNAVDSDSTDK